MLWPYRRSALKNQRRWTFGGVFPPAWSALHPDDADMMRTQVLLESDPHDVEVTVRFLQVVGDEGVERVVGPGPFAFGPLAGVVDVAIEGPRLSVTIRNTTPVGGRGRARTALRHALCSTHTLLVGGRFVSATEADGCENVGTWPVLVGDDAMLSSPIILEDHPRIAPESPGDLFDGGEIDGLLALNILALLGLGEGRDARRPAHAGDPGTHREPDRGAAVDAVGIPVGTRVKLRPRAGGDVFDLALAGRDRGRRRGRARHGGARARRRARRRRPGARPRRARAPVLLLACRRSSRCACWWRGSATCSSATTRSGVALAGRVAFDGVDVVDFGIRGMDLAYALADYDVVDPPGRDCRAAARQGRCTCSSRTSTSCRSKSMRTRWTRSRCWRWRRRSAGRCRGRSCSGASRPAVDEFAELSATRCRRRWTRPSGCSLRCWTMC